MLIPDMRKSATNDVPLADLLGHHGGNFALLMSDNESSAKQTASRRRKNEA